MAEVDEEICDYFISEGDIPEETLVVRVIVFRKEKEPRSPEPLIVCFRMLSVVPQLLVLSHLYSWARHTTTNPFNRSWTESAFTFLPRTK